MSQPDWDKIAKECKLPDNWREIGYDTAETMLTMYERTEQRSICCPWPRCNFKRYENNIEQLFRHVHSPTHRRPR